MKTSLFITTAVAIFSIAGSNICGAPQTTKTLEEVEPRTPIHAADLPLTISTAGSFYLTENMTMTDPAKYNGIMVHASDVTIDLNGFVLGGILRKDGKNYGHGIISKGTISNLTIKNGTIRNWQEDGVHLPDVNGFRMENVTISYNGVDGLDARNATGAELEKISSMFNVENGIYLGGGRAHACTAAYNGSNGMVGIDAVISACDVYNNGYAGIAILDTGTITGCDVRFNEENGIAAVFQTNAVISGNVSSNNGESGIYIRGNNVVTNNVCSDNDENGIDIEGSGRITGNMCEGNTLGFYCAAGTTPHIENNTATGNTFGFLIGKSKAIVIKNTAAKNVINFTIAATNTHGPILWLSGGVIASINPWANISYN